MNNDVFQLYPMFFYYYKECYVSNSTCKIFPMADQPMLQSDDKILALFILINVPTIFSTELGGFLCIFSLKLLLAAITSCSNPIGPIFQHEGPTFKKRPNFQEINSIIFSLNVMILS